MEMVEVIGNRLLALVGEGLPYFDVWANGLYVIELLLTVLVL